MITYRPVIEDIVRKMYAGIPYGDRARKMGIPKPEVLKVVAMAEHEALRPVHSIKPTGVKMEQWR